MKLPAPVRLLRDAARDFGRDDALTHAAALALFTASSLAPMVLLFLYAARLVGGDLREQFLEQATGMLGAAGSEAIGALVESASREMEHRSRPLVVAVAVAAFSATVVFGHLQHALNRVWNVKAEPGWNPWRWARQRLLSFALLVSIGFLLVVSLSVSTVLGSFFTQEAIAWRALETLASLAVFAGLFAMVFRTLPDVRITWRETWFGAVLTAVLFTAGKFAIGTYLGMSRVGSAYGAAGSLLVLLVWVYYTSAIVLFGAEVTQAYVTRRRRVEPKRSIAHGHQAGKKKPQPRPRGRSPAGGAHPA